MRSTPSCGRKASGGFTEALDWASFRLAVLGVPIFTCNIDALWLSGSIYIETKILYIDFSAMTFSKFGCRGTIRGVSWGRRGTFWRQHRPAASPSSWPIQFGWSKLGCAFNSAKMSTSSPTTKDIGWSKSIHLFIINFYPISYYWLSIFRSFADAFVKIFKHEGFRGFYKGFLPGILNVSHAALQFTIYEEMKDAYNIYLNAPINSPLVFNFLNRFRIWINDWFKYTERHGLYNLCGSVEIDCRNGHLSLDSHPHQDAGSFPGLQGNSGCFTSDPKV